MGDIDLRFYLSIFLRRLPYFVSIVGIVSAAAIIVASILPPVYRSTAKILVEAPQISAELAPSTATVGAVEQLQIIEQQITTRENLLALADRLNVYGSKSDGLSAEDIVDDMRSRTAFTLLQRDGGREGGITMFDVAFDDKDPEMAAQVVNELTALILQKNMRLRKSRAGDTMRFFEQEVARLGAELTHVEAEILKFKNDHKDALPETQDFRRNQQSDQQERLRTLEQEEASLRSRRNNFVLMFEATGRVANAAPITAEQQLLEELKRSLSDQLLMFSETSPNIVTLRARISSLEEAVRTKQKADAGRVQGKKGPSELDFQLSDIDERLNFIAKEKIAITQNLAALAKSIAATPGNETVLSRLQRDRDNLQAQYNAATARLAEASTGEQVEMRSKGERFSVVEPAVPPQDPISPNRKRIAGLGVIGAFGLGLGFVVLLELFNKSIRRPSELIQMFEAQPLATIPYIELQSERMAANLKIGLGFLIFASATYAFVFLLQHRDLQAWSLMERVITKFNILG